MQAVYLQGRDQGHTSLANQNCFIPVEPYNLVRLIEKYFPIQLESLRARDSRETPFFLVSRDTKLYCSRDAL